MLLLRAQDEQPGLNDARACGIELSSLSGMPLLDQENGLSSKQSFGSGLIFVIWIIAVARQHY